MTVPAEPALLFHLTEQDTWKTAQARGEYRAPSLEKEGFIHLSTPAQVVGVAERFYQGRTDLVLLVIAPRRLQAPVRFEDLYGHGAFPHLFGPLNLDAVVAAPRFQPNANGQFILPEEVAVYAR